MARTSDDGYGKEMIENAAVEILAQYVGTPMTVRQLFYRLVALKGYPNSTKHYKRVVDVLTKARWAGLVEFDAFIDRERQPYGETCIDEVDMADELESGKSVMRNMISSYTFNRWADQEYFVEVWIEKKALQGVFEQPCRSARVGLFACKGYPSLTALYEASQRFDEAIEAGKSVVILYFGDHDASGDDIPRSIVDSLAQLGTEVELVRCALTAEQVKKYGLAYAPTKDTDSRAANFTGKGQVELDALDPTVLVDMTKSAINRYFSQDQYRESYAQYQRDKAEYKAAMIEYVVSGEFENDVAGE